MSTTIDSALEPLRQIGAHLVDLAPTAAFVLVTVGVGLAVSAAARRGTIWAARKTGLETFAERVGIAKGLYTMGVRVGFAQVLGQLVWLAGLLITFASVAEMVGLPGIAEGTAAIVAFLPRLVAAAVVVFLGLFVADVLRGLVRRMGSKRADLESPDFVSQLVYYLVVTISVTLGVQQIGLETGLVHHLIIIVLGTGFVSLGVSFAIGSRAVFQNLLAKHYVERLFRPGDEIQFGEIRGVIEKFGPVSVVLSTDDGEIVLPCRTLLDSAVSLRRGIPPVK